MRAEHVPETPWIALWAEVVMVAHLVGEPIGALSSEFRGRLAALPARVRECAVGHAVDRTVECRTRSVQRWYDPRDLAREVASVLRDRAGDEVGVPHRRWRVGVHRFTDIARELTREPGEQEDGASPHPLSRQWARRGVALEGPTWSDQLVQLQGLIGADGRNIDPGVVTGDGSELRLLVRQLAPGRDDVERLGHALRYLGVGHPWSVRRLAASLKEN
ncbi:hypothetical protein GCM10023148_01790 [Actinokineospora soli]